MTKEMDLQNLIERPGLRQESPTRQNAESPYYDLDVTEGSKWLLVHSSAKAQERLVYAQECGEFTARSHYFTRRQGVDSYLIKIVVDGEGTLEYEGQKYPCPAGSFFWIDCRKPHYYHTSAKAGQWHMVWIHFWGGEAENYYQSFVEAGGGCPVGYFKNAGKPIQLIQDVIDRYSKSRNDYYTDIQAASMIGQLLTCCLSETVQNTQQAPLPERIQQICDYIGENHTRRLTLDDLSGRFFINKFYLQKQFRQFVGKSPSEYQNELRIDHAKELLRMTNMSVSEICQYLGLESTSYFIQSFKKREGVTPLQFRSSWVSGKK